MSTNVVQIRQELSGIGMNQIGAPRFEPSRGKALWRGIKWLVSRTLLVAIAAPVGFVFGIVCWLVCVAWSIAKWMLLFFGGLDLIVQFAMMVHHWHSPRMHPGWTFLEHFAGFALFWVILWELPRLGRR